jgi:protein-tyrosine phosphatase
MSPERGVDPPPARAARADTPVRRVARTLLRAEPRRSFLHDLRRSVGGEPALPPGPIRRVAVICHGNLCRSPFAAALLERAAPGRVVESFGLAAGDGEPADPRAIALAKEFDVELSQHRTRALREDHARAADLLLVMEPGQARALARRWPDTRARQRLLGDFLSSRPFAIADPWAEPYPFWRHTYARIALAVRRLAVRLEDAA